MKVQTVLLSLIVGLISCGLPVQANMGWIAVGGAAHRLSENPTVAMENEVVKIVVGKETVSVECIYVFINHGPACTVRMGFPDEPSEVDDETPGKQPFGTFLKYSAFVDGAALPVVKLQEPKERTLWHTSDVPFGENQTRTVSNVYTTCPTCSGDGKDNCCFITGYILHTGSSWLGELKHADIKITFEPDVLPDPLKLINDEPIGDEGNLKRRSKGAIYYEGPDTPCIDGRTLSLHLQNFKPTQTHDLLVAYGHITEKETQTFYEKVRKKRLTKAIAQGIAKQAADFKSN